MTVKMINRNLMAFISESFPDSRRIISGVNQALRRMKLKRTNFLDS